MAKNFHPLPEAIDGADWRVTGSPFSASVDLRDRIMFVPLDGSPQALFLRSHEMAHAAITPCLAPGKVAAENGCTEVAIQVCEDARVHWFLERAGIDRSAGGLTDDEVRAQVSKLATDPAALGAALVSTFSIGDHRRILDAVESVAAAAADGTLKIPPGAPAPMSPEMVSHVVSAANAVVRRVRSVPTGRRKHHPAASTRGFVKNTIPAARLFDALFGGGALEEMREGTGEGRKVGELLSWSSDADVPWGKLRDVVTLPMAFPRIVGRRSGRGTTHRDEGAMPNAVHRWAVDGRIFRRWRPAPGGTVLIDTSGSMHLGADDLRDIVLAAPASTVAMYSGRTSSGTITIVARRGKVADQTAIERAKARAGGGNVIDGPALEWLARQPAPRLWVCDGVVTGVGDRPSKALVLDAFGIARRAGIVRVEKASTVAATIAGMQRRALR